jgi:hypothetical protein
MYGLEVGVATVLVGTGVVTENVNGVVVGALLPPPPPPLPHPVKVKAAPTRSAARTQFLTVAASPSQLGLSAVLPA